MGFHALHPVVQHHIVTTLGWPGLRPLQEASVGPLMDGEDAILLAPTAGGKTEAAFFPVLSRMAHDDWPGVSVLYVCPLKALLNNLESRLHTYASWLGRRVGVWHGDIGPSARKRMLADPPDVLLTTPESLESMMVSRSVNHTRFLGNVRTIIIDEVHSFAGDDRGWHLQAVTSRLENLADHPIQRIGMSATVGNPDDLLAWLQGSLHRPGRVINPDATGSGPGTGSVVPDIRVDAVESIDQAATLLSHLHQGEKRLVFVDSRAGAERLASALMQRGVEVHLSHSSLSAAERRRSEEAFATGTDCIIVATSTLELGIDIGDLDRVIQIGSPSTVSSFLQRLGRTGRRTGTTRNCLFIALDDDHLLRALGMLQAWSDGYVEPVTPPVMPLHLAAQQFLAAALSGGALSTADWRKHWAGTRLMDSDVLGRDGQEVLDYLIDEGMLNTDGPWAFVGEAAEKEFGHRHFMELLSAFTSPPLFRVLAGQSELGTVEQQIMTTDVDGPLVLALAGRNWFVTSVDWTRKIIHVEPSDLPGAARWGLFGGTVGATISQSIRRVLLGDNPAGVTLTKRATARLADVRESYRATVSESGPVFLESDSEPKWWTWAGTAANQRLITYLGDTLAKPGQMVRHDFIRLVAPLRPDDIAAAVRAAEALPEHQRPLPHVDKRALHGLKFSAALPEDWAREVIARRLLEE